MKSIFLTISLLLFTSAAYCEIYKWVDENGKTHFGDKKPNKLKAKKIKLRINTYSSVTYDTSKFGSGNSVIIYSAEWCGFCKKAKGIYISFLVGI